MMTRLQHLWQQPLTRRERRFVSIGLILAAAVLFYAWVQLPLWTRLNAAQANLTVQQSRLESAANAAARLPQAEARVASLRTAAARANAGLPATKEEPQFLREIARLASASGVTLQDLSFDSAAAAGGLTTYPLRLSVSGSQQASRQFLASLENDGRVVQIRSFSYQGQTLAVEAVIFSGSRGGAGQ